MTLNEFYTGYDFTPPIGGMNYAVNVEYIISYVLETLPSNSVLELTKPELFSFFSTYKDEVLFSLLLSKKPTTIRDCFINGFEFRDIYIKLHEATLPSA